MDWRVALPFWSRSQRNCFFPATPLASLIKAAGDNAGAHSQRDAFKLLVTSGNFAHHLLIGSAVTFFAVALRGDPGLGVLPCGCRYQATVRALFAKVNNDPRCDPAAGKLTYCCRACSNRTETIRWFYPSADILSYRFWLPVVTLRAVYRIDLRYRSLRLRRSRINDINATPVAQQAGSRTEPERQIVGVVGDVHCIFCGDDRRDTVNICVASVAGVSAGVISSAHGAYSN